MYTVKNYKSKKELKEDLAKGVEIRLYAPGIGQPPTNGTCAVEGPHFVPHRWYAEVTVKDGKVIKVK